MIRPIHVGDYVEVNLEPWRGRVDLKSYVFCAHVARMEMDGNFAVVGDDVPIEAPYGLSVPARALKVVRGHIPEYLIRQANKDRDTPVGELP